MFKTWFEVKVGGGLIVEVSLLTILTFLTFSISESVFKTWFEVKVGGGLIVEVGLLTMYYCTDCVLPLLLFYNFLLSICLYMTMHCHMLYTFLQSVDVKNEKVLLETTEASLEADSLPSFIPEDSPRYHFYRFNHTHEGDYQEAIG